MSEPTRDEVELPELPNWSIAQLRKAAEEMQTEVFQGFFLLAKRERERQLKAALAANREKDAEIERLKNLLKASEDWRTAYQDGKYKLYAMGGDICDAAADHLPCGEGQLDRQAQKLIGRPEIRSEVMRATRAEAELSSLRASVGGEKAEDAYARGFDAGYELAAAQAKGRATLATRRYVAPLTLPTEKEAQ